MKYDKHKLNQLATKLDELPDEDAPAIIQEMTREFYRKDFYMFAKKLIGYKDMSFKTHGCITDLLQGPSKRKLICVPRGCLKSSIACVAFPIWLLINDPNLRILIDSELYTNSSTFIREIKLHMQNQALVDLFGSFVGSTWNSDEIIIKQRTKNLKEASISAGGVETTKVGQHFDYIIHDDLNSPKNSSSPESCQKVVDHYKYNTSILEPDGTMVIIGTRYSANDIIGHILDNEENDYKRGLI